MAVGHSICNTTGATPNHLSISRSSFPWVSLTARGQPTVSRQGTIALDSVVLALIPTNSNMAAKLPQCQQYSRDANIRFLKERLSLGRLRVNILSMNLTNRIGTKDTPGTTVPWYSVTELQTPSLVIIVTRYFVMQFLIYGPGDSVTGVSCPSKVEWLNSHSPKFVNAENESGFHVQNPGCLK